MAAGNETISALAQVLKTKYDQKKINILAYEDDPWLALVRKDTNFGGNNARVSLRYGSPQGGSITYGTARTNRTSSSDVGFLLTRSKDYHICGMDAEAMLAGKGEENTVLNTLDASMDGGMRLIKRSLEIGVYGDGSGRRGILANTSFATTVATLTDPTMCVNFEVGMKVVMAQPTSPFTPRTGTAVTVNAIDRDAGTITLSANLNTFTSVATNDLIIREGDAGSHIKGLAAWLPLTAPTGGDNFFGVDRSVDTTRLAGVRWSSTGNPKADTLMKANVRLSREGGKEAKRVALLNIEDYADMAIGLGAKAIMEPMRDSTGDYGFESIKLHTPRGVLPVLGSLNVPKGDFYILQTDTWVLKSIKGCPHIVEDDGLTIRRDDTTTDSVFWVLRYFAQLGCEAPAYNLHGQF